MLNSSNFMNNFNELDDIYTSESFSHIDLLTFLKENVYDSPMIYWEVSTNNQMNYECSLDFDESFIQLYYLHYKSLDNLHPQNLEINFLNKSNVICELDYMTKYDYENSDFYNNFLKKLGAYNIIQLHLNHKKNIFGIINFLQNKKEYDYLSLSYLTKIISNHEFYRNKKIKIIENYNLTKREHQVFNLLKNGYSYNQISAKLFISINTTKTHTKNIFKKLKIQSRYELKDF